MIKVLHVIIIFLLILNQNSARPNNEPEYDDKDSDENVTKGNATGLTMIRVPKIPSPCPKGYKWYNNKCHKTKRTKTQ